MTGAPPPRPATRPPEARGLSRDEVRLLVADGHGIHHTRFRDLGRFLDPGDLLVVNTSATLPSALDARRADGTAVVVHVANELDTPGEWVVELRRPDGEGPILDGRPDEVLTLPGPVPLRLRSPSAARGGDPAGTSGTRLWRAQVPTHIRRTDYLLEHGRPVTYGYLEGRWPLSDYQPVFGRDVGSAEMPSAGRPFTAQLVVDLVTSGMRVAPVTLHTGVSSPEAHERPQPERFRVPIETADLVNHTVARGHRVIAVGTTVVRALESATYADGRTRAREGWTDLVLGPDRPVRVVDGLITGWHDDGSSHLQLLRAVVGAETVASAYAAAVDGGYRWHEFGDSALLLRP